MNPSKLILCSGGLKALFLTSLASKEVHRTNIRLLFINHEQKNYEREYKAVRDIAQYYRVEWKELNLTDALPKGWPPMKLTAFLWAALLYARHHEFYEVYFGPSADDYRPEATLKYIHELKVLLDTAQPEFEDQTKLALKVHIQACCIKLTEARILKLGNTYAIPWHLAWSCDRSEIHHCGTCPKCIRRQQAFNDALLTDPTQYKVPYLEMKLQQCIINHSPKQN